MIVDIKLRPKNINSYSDMELCNSLVLEIVGQEKEINTERIHTAYTYIYIHIHTCIYAHPTTVNSS